MQHPMLFHRGKKGELRQWRTFTDGNLLFTEHGTVGGKIQTSKPTKCKPKNVGRANATTAEEQATKQCEALHVFKLRRKYSLTPEEAVESTDGIMKCKEYGKFKHKIEWKKGMDAQPKVDGYRMTTQWEKDLIETNTSSGLDTPYRYDWIIEKLQKFLRKGDMLDGELYVHGYEFDTIASLVKKYYPGSSEKIQFWVFDIPFYNGSRNLKWESRKILLDNYFASLGDEMWEGFELQLVPTVTVYSEEEYDKLHKKWVDEGFEGSILRRPCGVYEFGYRSGDVYKRKDFIDAEYEIVDAWTGVGKFEGFAMWKCYCPKTKRTFDVTPKGTDEQRKFWWRHKDQYIGKMLTVRFFELTSKGVPRIGVGKGIREEWDIAKGNYDG